jgi:hypothetical protein
MDVGGGATLEGMVAE